MPDSQITKLVVSLQSQGIYKICHWSRSKWSPSHLNEPLRQDRVLQHWLKKDFTDLMQVNFSGFYDSDFHGRPQIVRKSGHFVQVIK